MALSNYEAWKKRRDEEKEKFVSSNSTLTQTSSTGEQTSRQLSNYEQWKARREPEEFEQMTQKKEQEKILQQQVAQEPVVQEPVQAPKKKNLYSIINNVVSRIQDVGQEAGIIPTSRSRVSDEKELELRQKEDIATKAFSQEQIPVIRAEILKTNAREHLDYLGKVKEELQLLGQDNAIYLAKKRQELKGTEGVFNASELLKDKQRRLKEIAVELSYFTKENIKPEDLEKVTFKDNQVKGLLTQVEDDIYRTQQNLILNDEVMNKIPVNKNVWDQVKKQVKNKVVRASITKGEKTESEEDYQIAMDKLTEGVPITQLSPAERSAIIRATNEQWEGVVDRGFVAEIPSQLAESTAQRLDLFIANVLSGGNKFVSSAVELATSLPETVSRARGNIEDQYSFVPIEGTDGYRIVTTKLGAENETAGVVASLVGQYTENLIEQWSLFGDTKAGKAITKKLMDSTFGKIAGKNFIGRSVNKVVKFFDNNPTTKKLLDYTGIDTIPTEWGEEVKQDITNSITSGDDYEMSTDYLVDLLATTAVVTFIQGGGARIAGDIANKIDGRSFVEEVNENKAMYGIPESAEITEDKTIVDTQTGQDITQDIVEGNVEVDKTGAFDELEADIAQAEEKIATEETEVEDGFVYNTGFDGNVESIDISLESQMKEESFSPIASLKFTVDEEQGTGVIRDINVDEQYRGQELALNALKKLREEYPNIKFTTTLQTDDGAGFFSSEKVRQILDEEGWVKEKTQQPKAKETPVKIEEYTKAEASKKIEEETKEKPIGATISEDGKLYRMSDDSLASTGKEPEKIPIKYIYRAVSDSEYESIKKTGYIKSNSNKNLSSEKGLTVYKDSSPLSYLPEEGGYVLKVEVKQENGFYYDNNDDYVKTKEKIPTSQIVETLSVGHKEQAQPKTQKEVVKEEKKKKPTKKRQESKREEKKESKPKEETIKPRVQKASKEVKVEAKEQKAVHMSEAKWEDADKMKFLNNSALDDYKKTWEKLTPQQQLKTLMALPIDRYIRTKDVDVLKKLGRGVGTIGYRDAGLKGDVLLFKGLEEKMYTDGMILITDSKVAVPLLKKLTEQYAKDYAKKSGITQQEAVSRIKEGIKNQQFPETKQILDNAKPNLKLETLGFYTEEYNKETASVIFKTKGDTFVKMSGKYYSAVKSFYPSAEFYIKEESGVIPISIMVGKSRKGLVMPMMFSPSKSVIDGLTGVKDFGVKVEKTEELVEVEKDKWAVKREKEAKEEVANWNDNVSEEDVASWFKTKEEDWENHGLEWEIYGSSMTEQGQNMSKYFFSKYIVPRLSKQLTSDVALFEEAFRMWTFGYDEGVIDAYDDIRYNPKATKELLAKTIEHTANVANNFLDNITYKYLKGIRIDAREENAKEVEDKDFVAGEMFDTQGNSNMKGIVTLRSIQARQVYFTDSEGTDYSGFDKATFRKLLKEGEWKRFEPLEEDDLPFRIDSSGREILDDTKLNKATLDELKRESLRILGNSNVEILSQILTKDGQKALGKYMDTWKSIRAGQADVGGTFYHEAGHEAFARFLTPSERTSLIKETRREVGDDALIKMFNSKSDEEKYRISSYRNKANKLFTFYQDVIRAKIPVGTEEIMKNKGEWNISKERLDSFAQSFDIDPKDLWSSVVEVTDIATKQQELYLVEGEKNAIHAEVLIDGSELGVQPKDGKFYHIRALQSKHITNTAFDIKGKFDVSTLPYSTDPSQRSSQREYRLQFGIAKSGNVAKYRDNTKEFNLDAMAEEYIVEGTISYINKQPTTFIGKLRRMVEVFVDRWFRVMDNVDSIEAFHRRLLSGNLLQRQQRIDNQRIKAFNKYLESVAGAGMRTDASYRMEVAKEVKKLTTKILKKLEGKTGTVKKQFISDLTKQQDIKQVEKDIINDVLKRFPDDVDVATFEEKVLAQLLPLERIETGREYDNYTLPEYELAGDVYSYEDVVYVSPIKTRAGATHFNHLKAGNEQEYLKKKYKDSQKAYTNYFGHNRVQIVNTESGGKDGLILENQADLYQKGKLELESAGIKYPLLRGYDGRYGVPTKEDIEAEIKETEQYLDGMNESHSEYGYYTNRLNLLKKDLETVGQLKLLKEERRREIEPLYQYKDPTAHLRILREEIAHLSSPDLGIDNILVPRGETALMIEKHIGSGKAIVDPMGGGFFERLTQETLEEGIVIGDISADVYEQGLDMFVVKVLGDGKYLAVDYSEDVLLNNEKIYQQLEASGYIDGNENYIGTEEMVDIFGDPDIKKLLISEKLTEQLDINDKGEINTESPIYRHYEYTLGKYLKNNYEATEHVDQYGHGWWKVMTKPEYAGAVEAFRLDELVDYGKVAKEIKSDEEVSVKLPELVSLAENLGANVKLQKSFRKAGTGGDFTVQGVTDSRIRVLRTLFDPQGEEVTNADGETVRLPETEQERTERIKGIEKVLGHEIGHLFDWFGGVENMTLKRGNILGRIGNFRSFLGGILLSPEQQSEYNEAKTYAKDLQYERKQVKGVDKNKYEDLGKQLKITNKKIKELEEDALAKHPEVRKELKTMTQVWHPFDENNVPEEYLKYRYSSKELYAEALSVLFNDPKLLKTTAPTFYQSFVEYLAKKKEVKEEFFAIKDSIKEGTNVAARVEKMNKNQQEAQGKRMTIDQEKEAYRKQNSWEKTITLIKMGFQDVYAPYLDKLKREFRKGGIELSTLEEAEQLMGDMRLKGNDGVKYADDVQKEFFEPISEAGIDVETIGNILVLERNLGDRVDLANPQGLVYDYAKETYDYIKGQVTPVQWALLQDRLRWWRDYNFELVRKGYEAGVYSEEFFTEIATVNKNTYTPFAVVHYIEDNYVTAGIIQATGTLKGVENPLNTQMLKSLSLLKLTATNEAKGHVVKDLQEHFAEEIIPAKAQRGENGRVVGFERNAQLERQGYTRLELLEDGKRVAYYMDKYIVDMFDSNMGGVGWEIAKIVTFPIRMMNRIFKPAVTVLKASFQFYSNPLKDYQRSLTNITALSAFFDEGNVALRTGKVFGAFTKEWFKNLNRSWDYAGGDIDTVTQKMLDMYVLSKNIKYEDIDVGSDTFKFDAVKNRVVYKGGINWAESLRDFLARFQVFNKTLVPLYDFYIRAGATLEVNSKIAGFQYLSSKVGDKKASLYTRKYVGTPDFMQKGKFTALTNELFPFSNVAVQALNADSQLATRPSTASGYWFSTVIKVVLPKLLMLLGSQILRVPIPDPDDEDKKIWVNPYDYLSEYYKGMYMSFPVGYDEETGKFLFVKIPQDEVAAVVGDMVWKMGTYLMGEGMKVEQLASALAGFIPFVSSDNPLLSIGRDWLQYAQGRNPYDDFRGRTAIATDKWNEGGITRFTEMLKWTTNSMGVTNFTTYDTSDNTVFEKLMEAPILERMFEFTDYGITEREQWEKDMGKKEKNKTLDKILQNYYAQPTDKNLLKYQQDYVVAVKGQAPKGGWTGTEKAEETRLKSEFKREVLANSGDGMYTSIAKSGLNNDEKVKIINTKTKNMSEQEKTDYLAQVVRYEVVKGEMFAQYAASKELSDEVVYKVVKASIPVLSAESNNDLLWELRKLDMISDRSLSQLRSDGLLTSAGYSKYKEVTARWYEDRYLRNNKTETVDTRNSLF